MKKCSKCKEFKELSFFSKNKQQKNGLNPSCKQCRSSYTKSDYAKAKDRARYSKRSIKLKEYMKIKYLLESEKIKKRAEIYRKNNAEKHRQCSRNWQKNNPSMCRANIVKYKASKINQTPKWLNFKQFEEIKQFYIQAREITDKFGIRYEVDHIIPLRGKNVRGLHVPWNLQVITKKENCIKRNKIESVG